MRKYVLTLNLLTAILAVIPGCGTMPSTWTKIELERQKVLLANYQPAGPKAVIEVTRRVPKPAVSEIEPLEKTEENSARASLDLESSVLTAQGAVIDNSEVLDTPVQADVAVETEKRVEIKKDSDLTLDDILEDLETTPENDLAVSPAKRNVKLLSVFDQGKSKRDVGITRDIRRAIMDDEDLSLREKNITVITINGKVTLQGVVSDEEARVRAGELARNFVPDQDVENNLVVGTAKDLREKAR